MGIDVEVDIWVHDGCIYLGHDSPQYKVDERFVLANGLWCHAKNICALVKLSDMAVKHFFWHQTDDVAYTSSGYLWTYPGKKLTDRSIAVMPELNNTYDPVEAKCYGICSDYVLDFSQVGK